MAQPLTPTQLLRNRLGAATRRGDPPEIIAALRRELDQANIDAHLAAIDAAGRAGQMSASQRKTLGRIYRYGPAPAEANG
jgi:hypothetical protein